MSNRILRPKHLLAKTGLSLPTIWRKRREGTFPEPIQLTDFAIGWPEDVIDEWIASRAKGTPQRVMPKSPGRPRKTKALATPAPVVAAVPEEEDDEQHDAPPAPTPPTAPKRRHKASKPKPKPAPGATLHGHTRPPLDKDGNLVGNPVKCIDPDAIAKRRAALRQQQEG